LEQSFKAFIFKGFEALSFYNCILIAFFYSTAL